MSNQKNRITYTIKFFNENNFHLGSRHAFTYKSALREAERWVLAGKGYVSRIEWEVITGTKFVELDYYAVRQQRKARIAYRQIVKTNQFQNPYVSI
jgi:hypothetical protein